MVSCSSRSQQGTSTLQRLLLKFVSRLIHARRTILVLSQWEWELCSSTLCCGSILTQPQHEAAEKEPSCSRGKPSFSNNDLQFSWKECHFWKKNKTHYKKAVGYLGTPSDAFFPTTNINLNMCGGALHLSRVMIIAVKEAGLGRMQSYKHKWSEFYFILMEYVNTNVFNLLHCLLLCDL